MFGRTDFSPEIYGEHNPMDRLALARIADLPLDNAQDIPSEVEG
jgi:hypothetical protein